MAYEGERKFKTVLTTVLLKKHIYNKLSWEYLATDMHIQNHFINNLVDGGWFQNVDVWFYNNEKMEALNWERGRVL